MKRTLLALGIVAVTFGAHSGVSGQEPVPTAKPEAAKPSPSSKSAYTATRLQVTVSRYQAEKKVSSLPYSLSVSIGGPTVRFRVGAQVPYATTTVSDGVKTPSYAYRDVGIGIDVTRAMIVEPGLYTMEINVDDTSLSSNSQLQGAPTVSGVPIFRNFRTGGIVFLRDGQTSQLTTAADPITGEMMRVDVMLTVMK